MTLLTCDLSLSVTLKFTSLLLLFVSMCFISCLNDARYVCESGCLTACNQSPFMIGK